MGQWLGPGWLPDAECLTVDGKPVAADPTHPAYRARVQRFMQRLLSDAPGCYDADGLKVDGMTGTAGGPGLKTHGGLAGFELARASWICCMAPPTPSRRTAPSASLRRARISPTCVILRAPATCIPSRRSHYRQRVSRPHPAHGHARGGH